MAKNLTENDLGQVSYHVRTWEQEQLWRVTVEEKVVRRSRRGFIRRFTVKVHDAPGQRFGTRAEALAAGRSIIEGLRAAGWGNLEKPAIARVRSAEPFDERVSRPRHCSNCGKPLRGDQPGGPLSSSCGCDDQTGSWQCPNDAAHPYDFDDDGAPFCLVCAIK